MHPRACFAPIRLLLAALLLPGLFTGCADAPTASEPEPPSPGAAPDEDISEDIARAPPTPTLEIDAEPAALRFRWSRPPHGTHTLRLHVHDDRDGLERALPLEHANVAGDRRHPLSPHRTPWHDLTYRLEACSPSGCLSSRRERVHELAEETFRHLRPTLAADGERYGDAMAISADGALLALGLPTAGRMALWFTRTAEPRYGGTIDVSASGTPDRGFSRTRRLSLAISGNGDTIAVLSKDVASATGSAIGVFQRLGESWLETTRFAAFETPSERASARTTLQLSRDGRRLLVARIPEVADEPGGRGELTLYALDERDRWKVERSLHASGSDSGRLAAVSASADLQRVFVATVRDGAQPLLQLHARAIEWQIGTASPLSGFDADAPLSLAANALGTQLAVGGFEPRRSGLAAAVLWRYRVDATVGSINVSAEDSIVLGPPARGPRAATLVADARLDAAAMRWSEAGVSRLVSVVRDARGRWRKALILPAPGTDGDGSRTGPIGGSLAMDAAGDRLAFDTAPDKAPSDTFDAGSVSLLH